MDGHGFDIRDERFWIGTDTGDRERAGSARARQLMVDEEAVQRALKEHLRLSPEAAGELEIVEALFPRPQHPLPLARLLIKWIRFVVAVEWGYPLGGEDYSNDLDSRDLLERLMTLVPDIRPAVTAIIKLWDARFQTATRPSAEPLGKWRAWQEGMIAADGVGWWYFREPLTWPSGNSLH